MKKLNQGYWLVTKMIFLSLSFVGFAEARDSASGPLSFQPKGDDQVLACGFGVSQKEALSAIELALAQLDVYEQSQIDAVVVVSPDETGELSEVQNARKNLNSLRTQVLLSDGALPKQLLSAIAQLGHVTNAPRNWPDARTESECLGHNSKPGALTIRQYKWNRCGNKASCELVLHQQTSFEVDGFPYVSDRRTLQYSCALGFTTSGVPRHRSYVSTQINVIESGRCLERCDCKQVMQPSFRLTS